MLKLFISLLVIVALLVPRTAYTADCDWSQIKKNADGTYIYSEKLHLCVGKLVQDNKVKTQQITDFTKALSLKDLSIKASDDRANLWMDTSGKLEARLQKVDSLQKDNEWIFFGLGVLATSFAAYTASKLR